MAGDETTGLAVEFAEDDFERLTAVTDSPAELVRDAAIERIELEEAIAFTQDGGFHGPDGFARMGDDAYPTWPLGSLLGIELVSMGDGESRWTFDAGPQHANPLGTLHGGVLCDIGDAALSTAYMSTLETDQLFTTVDLTVNFLRPVREDRLEAVGEVVHKGRRLGLAESEVRNDAGDLVAKLSGTCMTLQDTPAE